MSHPPPSSEVLFARSSTHLRMRHLRLIAALAMKGTVGGAANEIGITQPAATQILHELEELLEIKLVDRHTRGIVFTEAGKMLLQFSNQTLEALRAVSESLADVASRRNVTLQVGALKAANMALVEPTLKLLLTEYPEGRFNFIEYGDSETLVAGLLSGTFDIIVAREPNNVDPSLVFEPLFNDELLIVAAPTHPGTLLDKVTLPILTEYTWVLPSPQVITRAEFNEWAKAVGFNLNKVSNISGNSTTLLTTALTALNAIAPVPASAMRSFIKEGILCQMKVDLQLPLRPLGALYRKSNTNPQVTQYLKVLRKSAT